MAWAPNAIGRTHQAQQLRHPKVNRAESDPGEAYANPADEGGGLLDWVMSKGVSMKLRPLHDHVLVKRSEEQVNKIGSLYVPDSAQEKPQEAEVISIGAGKQLKDGRRVAMEVKPGDKILFGKYSGSETKVGGDEYLILRESEILAVLG